ncbi:MAG: 2'-5' RNA ligase family protein [Acidobacteriota bacterium]
MTFESALVVLVPEAEFLVAAFRNQYDPTAALGVPAHVTVLYPFKPPPELTADVIQILQGLFSRFPGFRTSLAELGRFPGVLYLAPEPVEIFHRLIRLVTERFPETPPYGGQFAEVIPHLTVAQVSDSEQLEKIATDFAKQATECLPIQASINQIALLDNESGLWRIRQEFLLGTESASV